MAHIYRSRRFTGFESTSTPNNLGPGAYQGPLLHPRRGEGYAPFYSTSERNLHDDCNLVTPGPGTYTKPLVQTKRAPIHNSVFLSKSSRFEAQRKKRFQPGPGQYHQKMQWEKRSFRVQGEDKSNRPITWVRVATAPSIPTHAQSFGYEEGPSGELVMQPPPSAGHTGKGADTAGPGTYQLPPTTLSANRGFDFARRAARKGLQSTQHVPGPGAYDPGEHRLSEVKPLPTAAFRSTSQRRAGMATNPNKLTPGPGHYNYSDSFLRDPVPETMQNFGSTSRRAFTKSAGSKHTTPGPGHYDGTLGLRPPSRPSLHPFSSAAPRFFSLTATMDHTPGPGAYDQAVPHGDVPGGPAAFGSTRSRFTNAPLDGTERARKGARTRGAAQSPGPGQYADQHEAPVTVFRKMQPSSAFASAVPRIPQKALDPPLPPLDPEEEEDEAPVPVPPPQPSAVFHSGSTRFPVQRALPLVTPGPGSYSPTAPRRVSTRSKAFVTKTARFTEKPSATPGPGQYGGAASMVKRSYNVTIAAAAPGLPV
eukprot:gnl/Trimastix_PCT/1992.p1 GENE.gnl/Trimastix_PCT/1992~~gnl/Trimastix_PCT/1992.p1  ORF type:complete len:534 (+),score=112.08 gnl/Trimastix_PCT/1992:50-1651(+)